MTWESDKTTGQELQQLKIYRIENCFTYGFFKLISTTLMGRLFEDNISLTKQKQTNKKKKLISLTYHS